MTTLREAAQQALEAKQVPLRELLASVPADARLLIDDADGKGTRSIPVGRLCQEAAAALAEPDLFHCPQCGGPADNGHDRSIPPNPYFCTKCMAEPHTGVTLKPVLYANRRLTNEEIDAIVGRPKAEPEACPHGVTDGNCKECYEDGCDHCNHPMYCAIKCKVCGRVTEPVQEPYAWMSVGGSIWRHKTTEDDVPLYTAPRKPLAEWQINDLMSDIDPEDRDSWSFRQGVYAAEKHHGVRR